MLAEALAELAPDRKLVARLDIGDVDRARLKRRPSGDGLPHQRYPVDRPTLPVNCAHGACVGSTLQHIAVNEQHEHVLGPAEAQRVPRDRIEHWLVRRRRGRDRVENVRGGSLSLEGLLRLVEQPDVLDRDRRLVGERLDKLDLLGSEGPHLVPGHADDANERPVASVHR